MSPEVQLFFSVTVMFLFGVALGYGIHQHRLLVEVAEWKAIARKAQSLNLLYTEMAEERKRGNTDIPY